MNLSDRFWSHVDVPVDRSLCWEWVASRDAQGYGMFNNKQRHILPHRFAHEALIGPIPQGFHVDHLCRNRACVNPAHLEAVTPKVNNARSRSWSALNAAKTHCHNGHPFDEANTRWKIRGHYRMRECRRCDADRANQKRWALASQTGQGLAEYALILGLIAIVAILALVFLGDRIAAIFSELGEALQ